MGVQNPLFETPVALDFPRQLDEIQCPKPFDVGFRPDVVNHHLADVACELVHAPVAGIRLRTLKIGQRFKGRIRMAEPSSDRDPNRRFNLLRVELRKLRLRLRLRELFGGSGRED